MLPLVLKQSLGVSMYSVFIIRLTSSEDTVVAETVVGALTGVVAAPKGYFKGKGHDSLIND